MTKIKELTLYSYFYSSASWRIRSALAMKNIPYKYELVHLKSGQQHSDEYIKINPMHQAPALKVELDNGESHILTQSLAIMQFLEENYPNSPSFYPNDTLTAAKARAVAETISSGIQPLQNFETLLVYTEPLGLPSLDVAERSKLAAWWINRKLANLEKLVAKTAGKYCVGDSVTVADICLVPQLFNARRFECDTTKYPLLHAIDERLMQLDMFKTTHPHSCPDTPEQLKKLAPK